MQQGPKNGKGIAKKLVIVFATLIAIILLLNFASLRYLKSARKQQKVTAHAFQQLQLLEKLESQIHRQFKEVSDFIIFGETELEEFDEFQKKILATFKEIKSFSLEHNEHESGNLEQEGKQIEIIEKKYLTLNTKISALMAQMGTENKADALSQLQFSIENEFEEAFITFIEKAILLEKQEVDEINRLIQEQYEIEIILAWSLIAISVIFSFFAYRNLRASMVSRHDLESANQALLVKIAEKEEADKKVYLERQNLYDMLDSLPMAFHLQAPDYSVPFANKVFRETFGDPQKRKCHDLMHNRTQPCEVCEPFRVFDHGKDETTIWEALSGRTYITVCTPFTDVDGSPLVMEMALDITEQEKAKKDAVQAREELELSNIKVQQSEERLNLAMDASLSGVWDWNIKTGEVIFSPKWCASLGYAPNELAPHVDSWKKLVHPKDMSKTVEALEAHFRGETEVYQIENRLLKKDGSWRWNLDIGKVVVWDAEGNPLRMVGVDQDITEQKKAEEGLRSSENRIRLITDSLPVLISYIDRQHYFRFNNKSYEDWFEKPRNEITGKHARELMGEKSYGSIKQYFDKALSGERVVHETIMPYKHGPARYIQGEFIPDFDDQGKVKGIFALVSDITMSKQAEKELTHAKEEAEKASQAKSEFLARMSHELRTPMNAILGFGQLLTMDPENPLKPRQETNVRHILKAGQHLLELINEVLDLSKIESGNMTISIEEVPLHSLLSEILELLQPMLNAKKISFNAAPLETSGITVLADRVRLKQVLLNLISNAVKYNHPGGSISVACRKLEDSKIQISVQDTGVGISPENLEKIFNPFHRVESKTEPIEGTGIGLTISRKLIHMINGSLEVQSDEGKGSCFFVTLPEAGSPSSFEESEPTP